MMEIRTEESNIQIVGEKEYLLGVREEWKQNTNVGLLDVSGMANNAKREGIEVSIRNESIEMIAIYEI
jgi:hypothetical protein